MKKKNIIIKILIPIVLIIIPLLCYFKFFYNKKIETFYLEEKYYEENIMEEKDYKSINELIKNKENFIVFIYQPSCIVSADFESILQGFLKENQIKILKVAFSEIKDTEIGKKITFYPSFIIFKEGKIVSYLDVNSDDDTDSFTSQADFKKWLTKYVNLKDIEVSNNNEIIEEEPNSNLENINLDYITKDDGKVNIYLFWGDGCPHCKSEKEFFESIKDQYGNLYNLYLFETWYNSDNKKVLNIFSKAMNEKVKGVPYTIIGNKTFKGYSENNKEEFISAITDLNNKDFDVYFDVIKKDN